VVAVALAAAVAFGVARVGAAAVQRERAQAAADAAALAGAADGQGAAAGTAAANGARLVRFESLGSDVVVTVEVGGESASARARAAPPRAAGPWDP
jgi:hypothetical protein